MLDWLSVILFVLSLWFLGSSKYHSDYREDPVMEKKMKVYLFLSIFTFSGALGSILYGNHLDEKKCEDMNGVLVGVTCYEEEPKKLY